MEDVKMEDLPVPDESALAQHKAAMALQNLVIDMHQNLVGKYYTYGPRIEDLWNDMGQAQREATMKSVTPGVISKHSQDSMGFLWKLAPEWNLRDITAAGSDFLLRLLEHRATNSLNYQFCFGFDSRLGDHKFILERLHAQNLRRVDNVPDFYTFFPNGEAYGTSVQILENKAITLSAWEFLIDAGLCIPECEGRLVLMRQQFLLSVLSLVVESLLTNSMAAALSKLSMQPSIPRLDIRDALDSALEQKASLDDDLTLIRMEPIVLAYSLDAWVSSRPELVADERGRKLPAKNSKVLSCALLDMIHNTVRGAAIWDYICVLLQLLETSVDKYHRQMILQEVTNVCHLEYSRLTAILKRHMSTMRGGSMFKRISSSYENGNARIILKAKPEVLAHGDQQRLHLLRLCQAGATATKAVNWLAKLGEIHSNNPFLRNQLYQGEIDALDGLAVIVAFIQSLSQVTPLPAINRQSGQLFVAGAAKLEMELNQTKSKIDLCVGYPILNILAPGVAEATLKELDEFIIEKTGTKIGFLYQDLIDDCITKLRERLDTQCEATENATKDAKSQYIPFPPEPPETHQISVHERRQKEKTRPAHSSVYEISSVNPEASALTTAPPPPEPFNVKPATAELFSTLFGRAESRGSIPWASFEAAMAELKFSVIPKFGSAYTFFPPESMAIQKPLTLHRPHKSRIEGYLLLIFARRLNRLYGWRESTFQALK